MISFLKTLLETEMRERPPFEAMILFVSTPDPNPVPAVSDSPERDGYHARFEAKDRNTGETLRASLRGRDAGNVAGDIALLDPLKHNWQQLLRAIRDRESVRKVWLIGSKEANGKGSHLHLDAAVALLAPYLKATVVASPLTPSFEDFNGLVVAVRALLRGDLKQTPRNQIVLDVTGGQKVTSIAGAALTMNNELRFQYVQTNPPFATRVYDLAPQHPPHLHPD
jgi:hypothetical protein